MTPKQFWTMCRVHDWHHMYSDDPSVYREGRESLADLKSVAEKSPELLAIYEAWEDNQLGGGAKPVEPKVTE